jgi:hypothetical protein
MRVLSPSAARMTGTIFDLLFRQTTPPSSAINESAFKQIILGLLLFSGLCLVI